MTLQEEPPDLLSAHPLHLTVFWAGIFQSAQCWLNSTIKFTESDSQWFIRTRAKPDLLKKFTVRSCPEVPICWWGLLQGHFIGGCREKWPKKTGTVHIHGKMNGVAIDILQLKVMKFFLGKLWRSFTLSRHSWVNLSIAACFPGWLTFGIFPTLPVVLRCLFFPYWAWWRSVCAHLCSWCDLKNRKLRESPPIKILQGLWKNRKPQCRLETFSQKCPEQHWKASISHLGCLPNSPSFSPGFFSLLLLLTSWFQLFYPGCWW